MVYVWVVKGKNRGKNEKERSCGLVRTTWQNAIFYSPKILVKTPRIKQMNV